MNKGLVALFFILCIAVIGAFFTYTYYEKPIVEKPIMSSNVSFQIYDNATRNPIVSNYIIVDEFNTVYSQGQSLKDGFILINLPQNMSFYLYSNDSIKYYNEMIKLNSFLDSQTIRLYLNEIGNITLSNNASTIFVNTTGYVRDLKICVRWSKNYIGVYLDEPIANKPKRLENKADRCYSLGVSPSNENLSIPYNFKKFGSLTELDYINVYAIDSDYILFSRDYRTEGGNGDDNALTDTSIQIKNI